MNSFLKFTLALLVLSSNIPAHAEEYAERGYEQLMRGNYLQAVSLLTAAVKLNPTDLVIRRRLCGAYLGAGMARETIQQLHVLSTVDSPTVEDLRMQGDAYRQLGENKIAMLRYKQALAVDPTSGAARIGLAQTLLYTGEYQQARVACTETLRVSRNPLVRKQALDLLDTLKGRDKVHSIDKA